MNIKRGLWRLSVALSVTWVGGWLFAFLNEGEKGNQELFALIGLGGGIFIWICYWIATGFFKDKSDSSES